MKTKKLIALHIGSFVGVFILMLVLYIIVDLIKVTPEAPFLIKVCLDILGVIFLTTAFLLWLWAWFVLIKQWKTQAIEKNLLAVAALLIGNIFGAYFVLYVHQRDAI
jgi:formate hydrogenlyase subunit 3/multisubunit Na+/H+ antiporter MnhD subunit